ncbi:hypothetical protein FACS1894137_02310 [Spirochaetia bacterium]|nr:hypothetical protein FACS1894137_02310 [Spirochaetia bacterium]
MKKVFLYFMLSAFCCISLQAQSSGVFNDKMYKARIGMKMMELETEGLLSLWFTDANTGRPLNGSRVLIDGGAAMVTDSDGLVIFSRPQDGEHRFMFQKDGYVTVQDTFTVMLGTIVFNKYSVPPAQPLKQIKIVLDWIASPADLDLHLVKNGAYHISYHDMKKSDDGTAWLDRDDTNGYGPETITISLLDNNASYRVYIHDYTDRDRANSTRLSTSKATVRIYSNNELSRKFVIPQNKSGVIWNACDIINGEIKTVNTVN